MHLLNDPHPSGFLEEDRDSKSVLCSTSSLDSAGKLRGAVSRRLFRQISTSTPGSMKREHIRECRRVLVAAKLGFGERIAAPYAYSIVKAGGTVLLVHVVEPFRMPNPLIGGYYQDLPTRDEHARLIERSRARLRALAPPEAELRGVRTEVEVLADLNVARALCKVADGFHADVLCIESHSRPGLTAMLPGSVALGVLRRSRRPVLLVWSPLEYAE